MKENMKSLRSLALLVAVGAFPAFLSAQAKSDSLHVAVPQVNATIRLVAGDPAASFTNFTVASAAVGTLQTKIAFTATRTVMQNDEVDIFGDLTLTLLERNATLTPTEDYSGPVYWERIARNVTHQVMFVLPREKVSPANATAGASATALVALENLPELLPAIYAANWPVVEDEHCEAPSNIGEDYAGPFCTGTMVVRHNALSVVSGAVENNRGFVSALPIGNQVKIVLSLHSTRKGTVGSASFFIG